MAATCTSCGTPLSVFQKLKGQSLCPACDAQARQTRRDAEERYRELVRQVAASPDRLPAVKDQLPAVAAEAQMPERELRKFHLDAFKEYLDACLEDDHLTEEEEARGLELSEVLGISDSDFKTELREYGFRLMIARVNDGRLPIVDSSRIILKKDEVPHAEMYADLLKEVAIREYRGGYGGVSFRVTKGVRFHTGGFRGKPVTVGTRLETEDTGVLTVTSRRAVFTGNRASIEMPYSKLLALNVFNDGIQFHLSNRKKAPLFKLENGQVIAAMVNAAMQKTVS